MTQYENENVLAMKIDIDEHYLLVGDTAGIISLFDVKDYPTADVVKPSRYIYYDVIIITTAGRERGGRTSGEVEGSF